MPLDRRIHRRFKLEAEITAQIIDQKESPVGSELYGRLQGISSSGASFTIQCSNKDLGLTLPAKMTTLTILFERGLHIEVYGLILRAVFNLLGSYTIHLQFSRQFSKESFKKLIEICQMVKSHGELESLQKELDSLVGEPRESKNKLA